MLHLRLYSTYTEIATLPNAVHAWLSHGTSDPKVILRYFVQSRVYGSEWGSLPVAFCFQAHATDLRTDNGSHMFPVVFSRQDSH
jgi:hypothetical protein